ncbi:unnamed protein product, partial [Trichogramma brassicae]
MSKITFIIYDSLILLAPDKICFLLSDTQLYLNFCVLRRIQLRQEYKFISGTSLFLSATHAHTYTRAKCFLENSKPKPNENSLHGHINVVAKYCPNRNETHQHVPTDTLYKRAPRTISKMKLTTSEAMVPLLGALAPRYVVKQATVKRCVAALLLVSMASIFYYTHYIISSPLASSIIRRRPVHVNNLDALPNILSLRVLTSCQRLFEASLFSNTAEICALQLSV